MGPLSGLTTGQSAMTSLIRDGLAPQFTVAAINTNAAGLTLLGRIASNCGTLLQLTFSRLAGGHLYMSAHRSGLGCVKDLYAIALWKLLPGGQGVTAHLHGSDFNAFLCRLPRWLRALAVSLYRRVDMWVLLSPSMTLAFSHFSPKQYVVLQNCLPEPAFLPAPKPAHDGPLRLLFLSNLIRSKGPVELAHAVQLAKAQSSTPPCILRIAGAPVDRDVEAEIRTLAAVSSPIEYLGPVSGTRKWALLQWADVVVLPTYYPTEALPVCLLEGAAAGCHLIATRAGYIGDLDGLLAIDLIESPDRHALASVLTGLDRGRTRMNGERNRIAADHVFRSAPYLDSLAKAIRVSISGIRNQSAAPSA